MTDQTDDHSDIQNLHNFEQLETMALNIARVLASYYSELLKEEVPDALAMRLVVSFQECILRQTPKT